MTGSDVRWKVTIPRVLSYCLFLFFWGFLFWVFRSYFIGLFIIVMIILPLISCTLFFVSADKWRVVIRIPTEIVTEADEVSVYIELDGGIPYFCPGMDMRIDVGNTFFSTSSQMAISIPLGRDHPVLTLPVLADDVGRIYFHIMECEISDWMGLIKKKVIYSESDHGIVCVSVPQNTYIEKIDVNDIMSGQNETEENSKKGYDHAEVSDIREYRPGDRMRDIHWKLSARMDELMLKERTSVSDTELAVMMVLPSDKDGAKQILRMGVSVINEIIKMNEGVKLICFDASRTAFDEYRIDKERDIYDAISDIFIVPLRDRGYDGSVDDITSYISNAYPYMDAYIYIDKDVSVINL